MSSNAYKAPPLNRAFFRELGTAQAEVHEKIAPRTPAQRLERCDLLNTFVNPPSKENDDWMIGHLRYRARSQARYARKEQGRVR